MTLSIGVLRYGGTSHCAVERAAANFTGAAINPLSRCTTPIELLANDGTKDRISHATGFFWARGDRIFLVTNWHVVSGRNPFTLDCISEYQYIPQRIMFHGQLVKTEGRNVRFVRPEWILEIDESMRELLSVPPKPNGVVADVIAIPIEKRIVTRNKSFHLPDGRSLNISPVVNDQNLEKIQTISGDECYIVGYPLNNFEGALFPIWTSGSIASETLIGLGDYPAFLVDAAVTPAMSGSPVFRKCNSIAGKAEDGSYIKQISYYDLIGIYAGRLKSKELEMTNLGYAWYATLIDQVIDYYGFGDVTPVLFVKKSSSLDPLS